MDEKDIVIDRSPGGRKKRSHLGGRVASQFQVALGLLGLLVCLLVVFGAGFLFGLWYQANDPIMPHDDAVALAEEQLKQVAPPPSTQPEMTFYSTLTTPDASEPPPPADASRVESEPPLPVPDTSLGTLDRQGAPAGRGEAKAVDVQPAVPIAATPPQMQAPAAPSAPMPPEASPASSNGAYYSVQVGSFRLAEQAHRLQQQLVDKGYAARTQLTLVPGKGTWYRVRVGKFDEREEADQTAQRLRSQERMDVLVTRESS